MENINQHEQVDVSGLTDWKKPPELKDLKQNFEDGQRIQKEHLIKVDRWMDNLYVKGSAKPQVPKGNSAIQPKLIRKQAEWRYAALSEPFLSTNEIYKVKPVTWEDRAAADQNQLVLNYQINTKIDKIKFVDEFVRTAVDEGTIIIQVGWCFEEEEVEEQFPVVQFTPDETFAPTIEFVDNLKNTSPSQYDTDVPEELKEAHAMSMEQQFPMRPDIIRMEVRKVWKTVKNHPTLDIVPVKNIVFDPTCLGDISKAQFAIVSWESCLSDLKRTKKYTNLDKIRLDNASPLNTPDHLASTGVGSFNFLDDPRKKIVVYEYWGNWDIDGNGIVKPIVCAWVNDTVIRMEENPFPDKSLPFVVEQYLPVRKEIYGEPDGELLEDNQKLVGAVTRGMVDIMAKSANGQTGMRKDMLDVTNRRKWERGQDYEFNVNVDPRQGVFMHTYPEIPASAQFMLQLQNMEAESLTGVKSYTQGVGSQSLGDVAAGIRGALDAASKRELGILRRLASAWVKVGRKIIAMNAKFLSDQEVVRVTNDTFVQIRKDDLAGNFDLELSISTAEEDNNKAEQIAFMLQTMGPNINPDLAKLLLADILKLRKMPDAAHQVKTFQPQPDPVAQKLQELQIAELESKIAKVQAETQKIMVEAGLAQAKTGTEQEKAANLKSDTDQKNLEFVEQESGVTQERDIQKIGEQARSQAELRAVDHQFTLKEKEVDVLGQYMLNRSKK